MCVHMMMKLVVRMGEIEQPWVSITISSMSAYGVILYFIYYST